MKSLSRLRLLATPWTAAYQAPPSMGFSRREYWSGVPRGYRTAGLWFCFRPHYPFMLSRPSPPSALRACSSVLGRRSERSLWSPCDHEKGWSSPVSEDVTLPMLRDPASSAPSLLLSLEPPPVSAPRHSLPCLPAPGRRRSGTLRLRASPTHLQIPPSPFPCSSSDACQIFSPGLWCTRLHNFSHLLC